MARKKYKFGKPLKNSQHDFSRIPSASIPRSVFNRSSGLKTAFNSGLLIPVFLDEALPGDTMHLKTQLLARLSTPIVPIMDNMKLDVHYFSVPVRLIWENWQRFMGERDAPGDSVDFLVPVDVSHPEGITFESVAEYMGVPAGVENLPHNALPMRAYNLIWNEWFRDQNLQEPVYVEKGDVGIPDSRGHTLMPRNKRHDYFTSCLPWPQKGEGVELPLGVPDISYANRPLIVQDPLGQASNLAAYSDDAAIKGNVGALQTGGFLGFKDLGIDLLPSSALTINTLRQAFQMQKMLERDARGGSRYVEIIRSHFGVISPDARLQRPEYLGHASFDVNVNPVLQNSASADGSTPQGNLAAYGVAGGTGGGFSHSFVEHCYVIGVASVRADLTYQQGLHRLWNRRTRFDFFWPSLAHLGEQAVLSKEIYASSDLVLNENVFGYQERYAEYRYKPSMITGKMRSAYAQSLDAWHLSQYFKNRPVLSDEFIRENIPLDRCLAVVDEPQFIADFWFDLKHVRPMPTYSVPGMIDHF